MPSAQMISESSIISIGVDAPSDVRNPLPGTSNGVFPIDSRNLPTGDGNVVFPSGAQREHSVPVGFAFRSGAPILPAVSMNAVFPNYSRNILPGTVDDVLPDDVRNFHPVPVGGGFAGHVFARNSLEVPPEGGANRNVGALNGPPYPADPYRGQIASHIHAGGPNEVYRENDLPKRASLRFDF